MTISQAIQCVLSISLMLSSVFAAAKPPVELKGYQDDSGTITILHNGDTADPYFAVQALLLAHDNGVDIELSAEKFVNWLVSRQKPDGTFDRFCKAQDKRWVACKTADADDALLAIWMRLLLTMPTKLAQNPVWTRSYDISKKSLDHLFQPSRGIYMVSPVYLHGLFMDNLEVWSLQARLTSPTSPQSGHAWHSDRLARDIYATFWQPVAQHFLVSTQLEQRSQAAAFYPDHVAQIFPLLFDFPLLPQKTKPYYQSWIKQHRAMWLIQGKQDYPWGVLAVLALRQGDGLSAGCWLRESLAARHSSRWAVTDEVAYQIVVGQKTQPARDTVNCN